MWSLVIWSEIFIKHATSCQHFYYLPVFSQNSHRPINLVSVPLLCTQHSESCAVDIFSCLCKKIAFVTPTSLPCCNWGSGTRSYHDIHV